MQGEQLAGLKSTGGSRQDIGRAYQGTAVFGDVVSLGSSISTIRRARTPKKAAIWTISAKATRRCGWARIPLVAPGIRKPRPTATSVPMG